MPEADTGNRQRIFLALWPDAQTRNKLHRVQQQFVLHKTHTSAVAVAEQNLHMTLHFIGSVSSDVVNQLSAALDCIKARAFEINIDQAGFFPKARILWLGSDHVPAELFELEKRSGQCVSQYVEGYQQKLFTPHITLFRKARSHKTSMKFETINWRVGSFALVESKTRAEGVEYSVLREWLLN